MSIYRWRNSPIGRAKSGLISPHKVIARMFSDLEDYDVVSGAYGGNGSTEGASLSQDGHKEHLVLIQGYVFSASLLPLTSSASRISTIVLSWAFCPSKSTNRGKSFWYIKTSFHYSLSATGQGFYSVCCEHYGCLYTFRGKSLPIHSSVALNSWQSSSLNLSVSVMGV